MSDHDTDPVVSTNDDVVYVAASTPKVEEDESDRTLLKPNWILYSSWLVSLLQPLQYGWSTSQLNYSGWNDEDECNARPVLDDTCMMFPGHTKAQWTFAVNMWIVGGAIGSLSSALLSDKFGRRKSMMFNCVFMVVGAVIQMSVSNIWAFMIGRVISGVASGLATGIVGAYISEISPPHLKNTLGVGFQISITIGILLVACTSFFANSSSGWRYIAGFPILIAALFMLLTNSLMVESPVWLLMQGRRDEAEAELTRLFGQENVHVALKWLEMTKSNGDDVMSSVDAMAKEKKTSISDLFKPTLVRQALTGIGIACAQQLSGINAVFYYSSDIFSDAGISDDRVGSMIVDVVNVLPTFFSGMLAHRYGNRRMLLVGMAIMFVSAIMMTVALLVDVSAMTIIFTATYVAGFGISLGPLLWVVIADLFPDDVRATATSVCIALSWLSNLVVGVSYPYIADALDDYGFVPFVVTLALAFMFTFHMVPETSGKTNEEIQAGFRKHREMAEAEGVVA